MLKDLPSLFSANLWISDKIQTGVKSGVEGLVKGLHQ